MLNPDAQYAGMSDDDFETALESGPIVAVESPSGEEAIPDETVTETVVDGDEPEQEFVEEEEHAQAEETEEVNQAEEEGDEPSEELDDTDTVETDEAVDPQLAELFTPFKASGTEMQVKSVAEARQLMQMGVDYQNKMQGFKPHRKTIKTLENNEIDAEKLNYLIDLSKGDKNAIAKLIQESDFDVHSMDDEEPSYSPSDHSVSDVEVDLDDVIGRIKTSPSFSTTSDIVSNQWDTASKQAVFENPQVLERLNQQVADGTYDRIKQEVVRARAFGGLQGLSELQAYQQVGQQLHNEGAFNTPAQSPKRVATKPMVNSNSNTDKKLRASPAPRSQKTVKPKYDFAKMDDDEFEKMLNK